MLHHRTQLADGLIGCSAAAAVGGEDQTHTHTHRPPLSCTVWPRCFNRAAIPVDYRTLTNARNRAERLLIYADSTGIVSSR